MPRHARAAAAACSLSRSSLAAASRRGGAARPTSPGRPRPSSGSTRHDESITGAIGECRPSTLARGRRRDHASHIAATDTCGPVTSGVEPGKATLPTITRGHLDAGVAAEPPAPLLADRHHAAGIPIEPAAPTALHLPRLRALALCRRRPVRVAALSDGRHPQTCTIRDIVNVASGGAGAFVCGLRTNEPVMLSHAAASA